MNESIIIIIYALMIFGIIYGIFGIISDLKYALSKDKKVIKIDYSKYRKMKEEEIKQMEIKHNNKF